MTTRADVEGESATLLGALSQLLQLRCDPENYASPQRVRMTTLTPSNPAHSRYIVYVDESGDHGPVSAEYPMFVLAFCLFDKKEYANTVTSYMHRLKFKHFGHDTVVMHEREIRKAQPPFEFLQNRERRLEFMNDLSAMIEAAPFTLIAAAIHKAKLVKRYTKPVNAYHLALQFGLERIESHRRDTSDSGRLHVVFESRGRNEDRELELEFRRVCAENALGAVLDHEPVFSKKDANHCGLQLPTWWPGRSVCGSCTLRTRTAPTMCLKKSSAARRRARSRAGGSNVFREPR